MAPQIILELLLRRAYLAQTAQHNFTSNNNSDHPAPSLRHASFSVYIALAVIILLITGVLLYAIHSCYVSAIYHANIRLASERLEANGHVSSAKWKSRFKKGNRNSLKKLLLQPGSTSSESLLDRSPRSTSSESYSNRSRSSFGSPRLPINYPTPRLDLWPSNRKSDPFTVTNMNTGAGRTEGRCHSPRDSSGEPLNLPKKCYDPKERVTPLPVSDQENANPYHDSKQAKDNTRRSLGWGPVRKSMR